MADHSFTRELQPPIDLSHYYSRPARARQPNPMKEFYKYFQIPGIGNLAGGLPNNNYFPFDTLEAVAALPDRFKPTPPVPVDPPSSSRNPDAGQHTSGSRVVVPKQSGIVNPLRKIDLKSALQYGDAQGYPPLYAWIRQFTKENLHPNVPYKGGPEVILTCGNTDGFSKAVSCFMDVWREGTDPIEERPSMLVEEFTYSPPSINVKPYGANIIPVAIDDVGMIASGKGGLEDVLGNWDYSKGRRPHVMYTVTMGQNPTGSLLSVQRRKDLYEFCVKYDVLIIEDDPYWYLQYPSANTLSEQNRGYTVSQESRPGVEMYNKPNSSGYAFLDSLVPSYLSVDYQGRVIRLDTFSKTVAPGCRLGWITAQPDLIQKILLLSQQTTQQPSGFVQSMIAQLVMGPDGSLPPSKAFGFGSEPRQSGWKVDGWVRWLEGLRGNYERRMQTMCTILDEGKYLIKTGRRRRHASYLAEIDGLENDPDAEVDGDSEWRHIVKEQLYSFDYPLAGMFVWLRVDVSSHPLARAPYNIPHPKLARALWVFFTTKPYLVLCAPGTMFSASDEIKEQKGWQYFRICFAAADEEEIEGMSHRFVSGVQDFWKQRDIDEVNALYEQSDYLEIEMRSRIA